MLHSKVIAVEAPKDVEQNKVYLTNASEPVEAVLIKRQQIERLRLPEILLHDYVVLRSGPIVHRVASQWLQKNLDTGEVNEQTIRIETYYRYSHKGWHWDKKNSITLRDRNANEIQALAAFLGAVCADQIPSFGGKYLVVPLNDTVDFASLRTVLNEVPLPGRASLLSQIIALANEDPNIVKALSAYVSLDPESAKLAGAAIILARYSAAVEHLQHLIDTNARESEFQKHLTEHPWMFGSEYSQLIPRRAMTRDQKQDFVQRRTTDGFLEITEIKTPLRGAPLFLPDDSHNSFYPRSELSAVLGQVINYISEIEADKHRILAVDGEHVAKVRAKIIIGCTEGNPDQVTALRQFNGHLHGIEIITFDQLLRIAKRVISYMETVIDYQDETAIA
jgi:hypothetical protein